METRVRQSVGVRDEARTKFLAYPIRLLSTSDSWWAGKRSLKDTPKCREEPLPASLPSGPEKSLSLTSKVVPLTVVEKGKIRHLGHFQPGVEDYTVSKFFTVSKHV